jgi:hypothetical protein
MVLMELVRYHGASLLPSLAPLSEPLAPLLPLLRKALALLPPEKRPSAHNGPAGGGNGEGPPRKKTAVFESPHPYRSNSNDTILLHMPRAERMSIVFDEASATERDYDYLIFWKDDSRTERWHVEEKYTGRNGSENFPGFGGRPPLVIEGDYANIEFRSDGSNEDWCVWGVARDTRSRRICRHALTFYATAFINMD